MKHRFCTAFVTLLALPWALSAQEPMRTQLLRLVPEDVAFCLVVNDLRAHSEKLTRSEWAQKLRHTPLGEGLAKLPELLQRNGLGDQLKKHLNLAWTDVRDEVLGDAVVFAYRPGPAGKPEGEEGIVLLAARKPALLATLVERLNREQMKSGEIKQLQVREHRGLRYHRRVERAGESFYYLDGPILALAASETILQECLARRAASDPLPDRTALMRNLSEAGADQALGAIWINPRRLESEKRARSSAPFGKAIDGLTMALRLESEPEFIVAVHAHRPDLPAQAQRWITESAKPSELWRRFPQKSVLAFATRIDSSSFAELFAALLGQAGRKEQQDAFQGTVGMALREQLAKDLRAHLGPDVGACILAPQHDKSPPHILAAIRLGKGTGKVPLDRALLKSLHFFTSMAVAEHNLKHKDQPIQLKSVQQGAIEVRYLVGAKKFPPGFQPAFALKEGYLLLASSPEIVRQFGTRAGEAKDAGTGSDEAVLLRISMHELSRLLKERRGSLIEMLTSRKQVPPEVAGHLLESTAGGMDAFRELALSQRTSAERVTWIVRLRVMAPPPKQ